MPLALLMSSPSSSSSSSSLVLLLCPPPPHTHTSLSLSLPLFLFNDARTEWMDGALDIPTRRGVRSRPNILRASVYRRLQPVLLTRTCFPTAHMREPISYESVLSRGVAPRCLMGFTEGVWVELVCVRAMANYCYCFKNANRNQTRLRLFVCFFLPFGDEWN